MYALMGLYKGKVQNIFAGSYILPSADDKRNINISREKVQAKKDRGKKKKKLSIKKNNISCSGLGGLSHKKRREELPEGRSMSTNIERHSIWYRYVYSFELIPKKIWL
jgi:hypothetical protein